MPLKRVNEILKNNPKAYWMQQYHDDIHYIGYQQLANIIRNELAPTKCSIVGAIGTGCSTGGLIRSLRRDDKEIELIGVEPFGSVSFGSEFIDDPDAIISGIGSAVPFKI